MSIIKLDPLRSFGSLARVMNGLANDFDKDYSINYGNFFPKVDISETEQNLYINAELPGMTKEDIKVTIDESNTLIIRGTKERKHENHISSSDISDKSDKSDKIEKSDKSHKVELRKPDRFFMRIERSFGEFSRSFVLPDYIKPESIEAKFENGVLNLTFTKKEIQKPKEIEISLN